MKKVRVYPAPEHLQLQSGDEGAAERRAFGAGFRPMVESRRKRCHRLQSVGLYVIVFLIICFGGVGFAAGAADTREEGCFVRNVIDGDTIELTDGRVVRYIGIDAPETMKREGGEWRYDPERFSVEAKKYNASLVSGKKITLEFDVVKKDKYDRLLAYVYVNEELMVNSELVRRGYAVVYTFPPNIRHMDILLEAQNKARRAGRGLWKTLEVIRSEEARNHTGKFRSVTGTVEDIYTSHDKVFLSMGGDQQKALTAIIYRENLRFFSEAGIDPFKHYKNREIEVTGRIRHYGGPVMIIDNPSQIRVID